MAKKLTPWFPPWIPPVKFGVYELPSHSGRCFAYWNGVRFGYRAWEVPGIRNASAAAREAFESRHSETCLSERSDWRGLAQDPNAKQKKGKK